MTRKPIEIKPWGGLPHLTFLTALTHQEHEALDNYGWNALRPFETGAGTKQQWYELAIRLRFGWMLVNKFCEVSTVDEYRPVMVSIQNCFDRATASPEQPWYLTEDEYEYVELGLKATDVMQRKVTRKAMQPILREATVYVRKTYTEITKCELRPLPPSKRKKK